MIDDYLASLERHLHVSGSRRTLIVGEVRDHLVDSSADLEARGLPREDAEREAIAAFGRADRLACEFNAQEATSTMRRTPAVIGAAGVAVAVGFVLAATALPHPNAAPAAGIGAQVLFFVAVVAFQCAVVAGARAASLVAACWRAASAPVADRRLVGRAATICAGGLVIASTAWLATMSVRTGEASLVDEAGTVAGAVLMVAGTLVAAVFAIRHRAQPLESDANSAPLRAGLIANGGERIVDLVVAHPIAACVATLLVASASAMSHAETTVLGALPWGVGEAAAVVAGFVLLGPALGLRRRPEPQSLHGAPR